MYWLEEKRRTTELPGASQIPTLPPSSFGPCSIPTPLRVLNCVQPSSVRPRLSAMDSEPECEQEPFGRLAIVRDSDTTVRTTLALDFPRTDSDGDEERVHVALDVDAAPGCGGIAWPAGEVGSLT